VSDQKPSPESASSIDPRFPASAVPAIKGLRLSPGDAVDLVNISRSGMLVEGKTRFVPGTRVTVHFEGSFKPAQTKGRVVRCQVSSISGGSLRYHSGIQFEQRLEQHPNEQGGAAAAGAAPPEPAPVAAVPQPRVLVNRW
jgi:hypothetical protein